VRELAAGGVSVRFDRVEVPVDPDVHGALPASRTVLLELPLAPY
jgi:hypothetical protein